MIKVDIPGRESLELDNLVLDFNGTIAVDGRILENIKKPLKVITIPTGCAGVHKSELVKKLGQKYTAAIGNGFNDIEMFKNAELSVAVIEGEGTCSKLIINSDIVTRSIGEALNLFLIPNHIKADLRW